MRPPLFTDESEQIYRIKGNPDKFTILALITKEINSSGIKTILCI